MKPSWLIGAVFRPGSAIEDESLFIIVFENP
jgi:hypothetical protein